MNHDLYFFFWMKEEIYERENKYKQCHKRLPIPTEGYIMLPTI